MPRQYTVVTPDGKRVTITGPDDATDDELIDITQEHLAKAGSRYAKGGIAVSRPVAKATVSNSPAQPDALSAGAQRLVDANDALGSTSNLQRQIMQGASFGLSDEIGGVANAAINILSSPFTGDLNPGQAYRDARDAERELLRRGSDDAPVGSLVANVLGGFAGGAPRALVAAVREAPNALAAIKSGVQMGAAQGAIAGWGSGDGTEQSLMGGVLGGVAGGVLGGAAPAVAGIARRTYENAQRLIGKNNSALSREMVGKAFSADGSVPGQIGDQIDAARTLGVDFSPADTGENARSLLASVARQPGPSKTIAKAFVSERQAGQGERIRGAMQRDLGPIANVFEASDNLLQQARTASAPLYEQARAAPVISTPELDALLATPAGRSALGRARTIAANERRDPAALGFVLDADGNVALNPILNIADDGSIVQEAARQRGYTTETIDLVKRGLDDALADYRDPLTGRLSLDESGRSIERVRSQLVAEADRLNPVYAEARRAYAGPAAAREALEDGRDAVSWSAEELARRTKDMSPADLEQFKLGYRSALAGTVDKRVDGGDKSRFLLGTPAKRAALRQLFGEDELARFEQTMALEGQAAETYRSVIAGSQTAERNAADALTADNGLMEEAAGSVVRAGRNGGWGAAFFEGLSRLNNAKTFGAGKAGENVRQDIATLLTQSDPAELRDLLQSVNRQIELVNARTAAVADTGARTGASLARGLTVAGGNTNGR